ncbi:MAG: MMPL family transporter [Deltaproteobacteria bacterium]|nr:MMPL family transporter [Deltaproteobacteria bacterium]MBN2674441.1 MMPL family transporter [Deltaproteobacteria bacterium]
MLRKTEQLAEKLARAQLKHPLRFLVCCAIITVITSIYATGLTFDSSYEALLPVGAKEIENVDAVREQTGGTRQLVIAIKGKSPDARIDFARKIAPKLEKLAHVRCVDYEFPVDFFRERALWLANLDTLDKLIPAIEDAVNIAKSQANPLALHLDEAAEKKELEAAWKKVEKISKSEGELPFNEILHSKDNRYTFLILVPTIKFTDMELARELLASIKNTVSAANPSAQHVSVQYAGALEVLAEQHVIMRKDMVTASVLAAVFGILIVVGFTRKILAPVVVSAALLAGIVWTFAMARVYVGHVNIITGFLAAVLIGLGIDFGIHLFVRYIQEFQNGKQSREEAFVNFVKGTAAPALTAALTTAGVFFSFSVAKFRGFSEFGLIAGTGVMFTLASSFLILPALLLIVYRNTQPGDIPVSKKSKNSKNRTIPMPFATGTILLLLALSIYGGFNIQHIPFKNDFRQLRGYSEATEFFDYVNENLGAGFNPAVFVVNSIQDAATTEDILTAAIHRKGVPAGAQVDKVLSVNAVLPKEVDEHQKRIRRLHDILWAPALDRAADKQTDQGRKLRDARTMVNMKPWKVEDIPETFRRRFLTVDREHPRYIVYTWSKGPHDADYIAAQWEKQLGEISEQLTAAGVKHDKADETLIISWVYRVVKADGTPLLILAAGVVLFLLIVDFRNAKDVILLMIPLAIGMLSFAALLRILRIDFNMFNMVVIPSVIGIGIDNAVHILHRYKKEGPGSVVFVLKHTGAAALLASVTTAVGFGASVVAHNLGLQSLGYTAMLGIGITFIAAVFLLPCILSALERFRKIE